MGRLTEIEAALRVGMSPTLLRWFTKYAPKFGETRKLPYQKVAGEYFYEEADLVAFDSYLWEPWPTPPKGQRPNVPTGITMEILVEANHKCAFCEYVQSGECAHIKSVKKSRCNHPHNLIWSCHNHHTQYDDGHTVETVVKPQHVEAMKEMLRDAKMRYWRVELRTVSSFLSVIGLLRKISEYLKNPAFAAVSAPLATLAQEVLDVTTRAAKDQQMHGGGPGTSADYQRYAGKIAEMFPERGRLDANDVATAADRIGEATQEYLLEESLARCPVCNGTGDHNRHGCRVCAGSGTVPRDADIDLRPFEQVKCPLCDGSGDHNRFECPCCSGVGTVDNGRVDSINLEGYEQARCPVCNGSGDFLGYECRLCHGVGKVDEGRLEGLNLDPYEAVECPVCDGSGVRENGKTCALCRGEGKVDDGRLENLDVGPYELVECPRCKGSGEFRNAECGLCEGSGRVDSGVADEHDPFD